MRCGRPGKIIPEGCEGPGLKNFATCICLSKIYLEEQEEGVYMKTKIFTALTDSGLEKKLNQFLANPSIKFVTASYSWGCSVMVVYEDLSEGTN
ncbi:hypothetical protein COD97_16620 [Bacillus cereus]|nr:hypothetical protein COD97_16620 [Bacillus cereus]